MHGVRVHANSLAHAHTHAHAHKPTHTYAHTNTRITLATASLPFRSSRQSPVGPPLSRPPRLSGRVRLELAAKCVPSGRLLPLQVDDFGGAASHWTEEAPAVSDGADSAGAELTARAGHLAHRELRASAAEGI